MNVLVGTGLTDDEVVPQFNKAKVHKRTRTICRDDPKSAAHRGDLSFTTPLESQKNVKSFVLHVVNLDSTPTSENHSISGFQGGSS